MIGIVFTASVALSEVITIVGNGPELRVIEQLTRFFEKKIPGAVAEIRWDSSFHPINMVNSGEADFAVAGQSDRILARFPLPGTESPSWWTLSIP